MRAVLLWALGGALARVRALRPLDEDPAYRGLGDASNATTWARVESVDAWLRRGGPTPPHWRVTGRDALHDDWKLLRNATAKSVWRTSLRRGREPVVVKTFRGDPEASAHAREAHATEVASEILYFEFLRGLPGVPELVGGWNDRGAVFYATRDGGDAIYAGGFHEARRAAAARYGKLARKRPRALARAWVACFWSFAERGGFFLDDFASHQFAVRVDRATGVPEVALVDAPKALAPGPAYDLLASFPRPHVVRAARDAACAADADCPASGHPSHCCCCPEHPAEPCALPSGRPVCADGSRGAPEAKGACFAKHRACVPLSAATHAFDLAAKAWALPFVYANARTTDPAVAAVLKDLLRDMAAHDARNRPTLSDAYAALAIPEASDPGGPMER